MKKVYTNKWAKKLRYQLRSKKRVTVIRTRNPTWRIKEESLAENAKASITTRHTPSNTNAVLSVFHVGPWNPFNKTNHHQCLDYIYMYIYEKKRERERLYGRWHRELVLRETQLVQMIWLPHLISYFPFLSVIEIWKPGIALSETFVREREDCEENGWFMDQLVQQLGPTWSPYYDKNKRKEKALSPNSKPFY